MTVQTVNEYDFDGDPTDSEYWWNIIALYHRGYDPNADGMITVPVDQLETLQQSYTRALSGLEEIAGDETVADKARSCLEELKQ